MEKVSFIEKDLKESFSSLLESRGWLLLDKVSSFLAEQNIESYLVGGLVRDVLLGRDTADIDIAVASDALEIAPKVAAAFGGKYVPLDRVNRVGRVVLIDEQSPSAGGQWEIDFTTFQESIEQDLARRDFTIDAMAVDLSQLGKKFADVQLIDPFKGRGDLRRRVLRVVTETVFESDAVRLLRAVRLAAELGFSIDKKTQALIQRHSHLIADVAGERIREELLRLLAVPRTEQLLFYLDELGLLTAMFPELAQAKGVKQPKEHSWDVFEHSLKTVTAIDFLLRQGTWEHAGEEVLADVPWSVELAEYFAQEVSSGSTRGLLLKLAAFLHDVGKPQTKAIDVGGRMRFLGHAIEGVAITEKILERLRFSAREIKLVETLVRYHMRPGQMSLEGMPTNRAVYRYFRDSGEAGIDVLFLSLADHLAARGPSLISSHWQEHARLVEYVLSQRFEQESVVCPPKLVDGHDLIDIFAVNPGPEVGEVLEAVREAQASGEITTRQEALDYARDYLLAKAE